MQDFRGVAHAPLGRGFFVVQERCDWLFTDLLR